MARGGTRVERESSHNFMLMNLYNSGMKRGLLIGVPIVAVLVAVCILGGIDVHAAGFNASITDGASAAHGVNQPTDLFGETGTFRTITNVMLYLVGAISVIMLIIGGIRYVVSGGDSTAVQGAKNTILYAIVGIVVSILAYAVVSFVISSFTGADAGGGGASGGIAPTSS
jgi:hypothetical protein